MSFTTRIFYAPLRYFNFFSFEIRALIVADKKGGGKIASRDPWAYNFYRTTRTLTIVSYNFVNYIVICLYLLFSGLTDCFSIKCASQTACFLPS